MSSKITIEADVAEVKRDHKEYTILAKDEHGKELRGWTKPTDQVTTKCIPIYMQVVEELDLRHVINAINAPVDKGSNEDFKKAVGL